MGPPVPEIQLDSSAGGTRIWRSVVEPAGPAPREEPPEIGSRQLEIPSEQQIEDDDDGQVYPDTQEEFHRPARSVLERVGSPPARTVPCHTSPRNGQLIN